VRKNCAKQQFDSQTSAFPVVNSIYVVLLKYDVTSDNLVLFMRFCKWSNSWLRIFYFVPERKPALCL